MAQHSKYPPSSAYRWLNCPASVLLPPDEAKGDTRAADEGTLAHKIAELKLTADFWNDNEEELEKCRENELYDPEMEYYTDEYIQYIRNHESNYSQTYIETYLDMGHIIPGLFGTCDCIIYDSFENSLRVIDFKYGRMKVQSENNPQLILYVLGALKFIQNEYPDKDLENIKISAGIYQPRIQNIDSRFFDHEKLNSWLRDNKQNFKKIEDQVTERNPGNWCKWCDRQIHCRDYQEGLMDCYVDDFFSLSDKEIAKNLAKFQEMEKLIKKLKEYGINRIKSGRIFPGYKIREVKKKSWNEDNQEKIKEIAAEFDLMSVMSPSQALKKLGKPKFKEVLEDYVETTLTTQLVKERN